MQLFELGTMVTDTVSGTKGMLTHAMIDMDHKVKYIYQPKGLQPKTGKPVDAMWIETARISGGNFINVDIPLKILGTKAEDLATGFKGTVISIAYHINGCLHVELKPKGINSDTGNTIEPCDFDIRRLKGELITPLSQQELKKSIKKNPSPMGMPTLNYKK